MKGFNYPAATGPYKLEITKKASWRDYDTARFQISVGKSRYEGDKLFALCEWASHRFAHVDIIVSDTLQRHNHRFNLGCDAASAWKLSRTEGDQWLERNSDALSRLPSYRVIRWDELLNDERFQPITITPTLERALDDTIKAFWLRQKHPDEAWFSFYNHSHAFLWEELSVFFFLFDTPAMDIYAGSWFMALMEGLWPDKDYMSVDYIRNKSALV